MSRFLCCRCSCPFKPSAGSNYHDNRGCDVIEVDEIELETHQQNVNEPCNLYAEAPEDLALEDEIDPEIYQQKVIALHDFDGEASDDLAFEAGDEMIIIDKVIHGDWYEVFHVKSGKEGLIPRNYVIFDKSDAERSFWFDTRNRKEAETLLMLPGNPRGAYMVRPGRDTPNVLSVRDFDGRAKTEASVKHYRLYKTPDGLFYIVRGKYFCSIGQLIAYYRHNDGLCHKLTAICRRRPELLPLEQFEVERQHIELICRIGRGQFGEVWKASWRKTVEVAVKRLPDHVYNLSKESQLKQFLQEAETLHRLRHRHLVSLMGVCTRGVPILIVLELVKHGDLLNYLQDINNRPQLEYEVLIDMAMQICEGMAYLEEKRCIHRDLRACNVLVGEVNIVKIGDFGLARLLDIDEVYNISGKTLPIKWAAPEAIQGHNFSTKSDVWSFGILLYEIVTYGCQPYKGMENSEVEQLVLKGYRMPNPTCDEYSCPGDLYDIMTRCWNSDPDDRPTFAGLLQTFETYVTAISAVEFANDDEFE